jgi:hypothetical protein
MRKLQLTSRAEISYRLMAIEGIKQRTEREFSMRRFSGRVMEELPVFKRNYRLRCVGRR